jgi:GNAT superfamily N-acetyltransferase
MIIRPALPDESPALHALAVRSKAHWGYDAAFMARAAPALALRPDQFAAGRVLVAEGAGGLVGVAAVLPPDGEGVAEIDQLFVDPPAMGRGIGRALLLAALDLARAEGARAVRLLSDPQARPFYERHGFRHVADAPSDAIPGRMLPLMLRTI